MELVGLALDLEREPARLARQRLDHGREVEVAVRQVQGEHSARREVPVVEREGLARQEVHRDRAAREGVQDEHVEALVGLALEREARVAGDDLDRRR